MAAISDGEFVQFQRYIYDAAGITLSNSKKALVSGRLARRLEACRVGSFTEYLRLLKGADSGPERQMVVDLLTTNETYFFREPKHFQFLRQLVMADGRTGFRIWSAASSTGQEAYSIAMVLEDCTPGQPWEVVASDISTRVLARAQAGHYTMDRISNFPAGYLQRFCLKGTGDQAGTILVDRRLRAKVRFLSANLNSPLPKLGTFDVVFLRNVLIYFNAATKRDVVARVLETIKPGGYLLIGHSESLVDVSTEVTAVAPAIYRKRS